MRWLYVILPRVRWVLVLLPGTFYVLFFGHFGSIGRFGPSGHVGDAVDSAKAVREERYLTACDGASAVASPKACGILPAPPATTKRAEPCVDLQPGEPMQGEDALSAARTCKAMGKECEPVLNGPPYTQKQEQSIALSWQVLSPLACRFREGGNGFTRTTESRPAAAEIKTASHLDRSRPASPQTRMLPGTEFGFRRMVKEEFSGNVGADDAERRMQEYGMRTQRSATGISAIGSRRAWDAIHDNTYSLRVRIVADMVHSVDEVTFASTTPARP